MVKIEVEYKGEFRCIATHLPSGRELITDAPVDNHGKGEFFSNRFTCYIYDDLYYDNNWHKS